MIDRHDGHASSKPVILVEGCERQRSPRTRWEAAFEACVGAGIAWSYDLPAAVALRVQETGKKNRLWAGAIVTALAAIFFPRIQGIREEGESWWRLLSFFVPQDLEGVILVPLVIVLTIALFATVGRWAWRDAGARNRPAKVGLVSSLLGVAGVVVFWLSGPIVLGGLGTTLGLEARRRAAVEGRGVMATSAVVVGIIAFAIGASIWGFGEELGV